MRTGYCLILNWFPCWSVHMKKPENYLEGSLENFWKIFYNCTFIHEFWTLLKGIFHARHILDLKLMCF